MTRFSEIEGFDKQVTTGFRQEVRDALTILATRQQEALFDAPSSRIEGYVRDLDPKGVYENKTAIANGCTKVLVTYRNVTEPEVLEALGARPSGTDPVVESTYYYFSPQGKVVIKRDFIENGQFVEDDSFMISGRSVKLKIPMMQQYLEMAPIVLDNVKATLSEESDFSAKKTLLIEKINA